MARGGGLFLTAAVALVAGSVGAQPIAADEEGDAPSRSGAPSRAREADRTSEEPQDMPVAGYPVGDDPVPSAEADPGAARGLVESPPGVDAALFLPRAALRVPAVVLDVAFLPLRLLGSLVDEYRLDAHVIDFLYNDERTAAFYPVITFQPQFGVSLGAGAFHGDLFGHGERGLVRARFLGRFEQSYEVELEADRFLGTPAWVEGRIRYQVEPGLIFSGIGHGAVRDPPPAGSLYDPAQAAVRTRYYSERALVLLRSGVTVGARPELAKVGVTTKLNHRRVAPAERTFGDPSIETVYDTRQLPGFDARYNSLEIDANLVIDTRDRRGFTSNGLLLEAFGGAVPAGWGLGGFGHYGVEATGFVDLHLRRVITLRLGTEGVVGDAREIHFSELPQLGGALSLRGYPHGRFRDKTAVIGTLQYGWPVHTYVAADLFVDVGKVGPSYASIFGEEPAAWRPGVGGGFMVHSGDDLFLRLDVAWGIGEGVGLFFETGALQDLDERSTDR